MANETSKSGRWTYAEQRVLIASIKAGTAPEAVAKQLRRTPSSTYQKAAELGLLQLETYHTDEQKQAITEASRHRSLSKRCKELAVIAGAKELFSQLNAMAVDYKEMAWAVEAKAGLPLTRDAITKGSIGSPLIAGKRQLRTEEK